MTAGEFIAERLSASTSGVAYICSLPNIKGEGFERNLITRNPAEIDAFVTKEDRVGRAIYGCVSLIQEGATRRAKETVAEIPGIWLDIDFKDIDETPEEVDRALRELALPPSRIVASGNGRHAYWDLKEALQATDETTVRVERLLKGLAAKLGGDFKVAQVAALMRLPGTHNTKFGAWKEVTVIANTGAFYEPKELEDWARSLPLTLTHKSEGNGEDKTGDNPWTAYTRQDGAKPPPIDVAALLRDMRPGNIHGVQVSVSAALIERGMATADVVARLMEATRAAAGPDGARWDWGREERDLVAMCETWRGKRAKEKDADEPKPLPKLTPIRFIEGEIIPPREWIVPDWIPTRKVTLFQGDGGDGKTSLMQQLQSSCATGLPWIGLSVEECISIGFYTEEEEPDLKERQAWIDVSYGQPCASTGKMHLFPRADEENELVVFDRAGKPTLTPFYHQVRESALDLHARLIALDVVVDLFGGDEINRREVRAFMRPLNRLAREINGAVALTSHLSQAGIKSDGGHSGSTDWSNGSRSRAYLGRPKPEDGEPPDTNARLLTRRKANFASIGDTIKLFWRNGVILPADLATRSAFRRTADEVFLALLDAVTGEGQKVSPKLKAGNYAPALFMKRGPKEREDYRRPDFERAMQVLFQRRQIKIAPYGHPSDGFEKLVRADEQ
jgi:hypothetical protein